MRLISLNVSPRICLKLILISSLSNKSIIAKVGVLTILTTCSKTSLGAPNTSLKISFVVFADKSRTLAEI